MLSAHAYERALERYGLSVTHTEAVSILHQINFCKNAWLHRKEPISNREVWLVNYKGRNIKVVVSPTRDSIITFLPGDGISPRLISAMQMLGLGKSQA